MRCAKNIRTCRECSWKANGPHPEKCPECGADMRCGNDAVVGYRFCSVHGGPSPSRNYYGQGAMVTGSQSSFPLTRLAAKYNQMQNDGRVLSNRASIDIIDERVTQLLGRVDMDEAPERVSKLYNLWQEYKAALEKDSQVEAISIRMKIDKVFEKVYHDYNAWSQIFEALDLRGRQVEREVKILKDIHAVYTADQVYHFQAQLMAAVMKIIGEDPKKLKELQYEFTRLIGERSDNVIDTDDPDDRGSG